jgi:prevent-host-death family protein
MHETTVGIRELKAQISKYLRRVKAGQTLVITDHGKPVGRIVPVEETLEARMQRLVEAGIVKWNGKKPKLREPITINRGPRQVSDLVAEDREIDSLP